MSPISNIGIEDLQFFTDETEGPGENTITFSRAYNCYVKNIISLYTTKYHIAAARSHKILISTNWLEEARSKGGGGMGYGISISGLCTHVYVYDNIVINMRHHLITQVGSNLNIFAYNFNVDVVRDYCWENVADEQISADCSDRDWQAQKSLNGLTEGSTLSDVSIHGHMSHSQLWEGNVFYLGLVDKVWHYNGRQTFYRNKVLGVPPNYPGTWYDSLGVVVSGDNDNQAVVANFVENNSSVACKTGADIVTCSAGVVIGANMIKDVIELGDIDETATIPDSLFLTSPPSFWCKELNWPPYGPGTISRDNRIPAELRYTNDPLSCTRTSSNGSTNVGTTIAIVIVIFILASLAFLATVVFSVAVVVSIVKRKKNKDVEL